MESNVTEQHRYIWPYLQDNISREELDELFKFFLVSQDWFYRAERIKQQFAPETIAYRNN